MTFRHDVVIHYGLVHKESQLLEHGHEQYNEQSQSTNQCLTKDVDILACTCVLLCLSDLRLMIACVWLVI